MNERIEAMVYGTPAGTAEFARAATPAVLPFYASAAAAVAAINASAPGTPCAALVEFQEAVESGRPVRCNLSAAIVGADGETATEDLYIYTPTALDGHAGVRVEKIAGLVWTGSGVAIAATLGGRAGHTWAKAVAVTPTTVLGLRSGQEVGGFSQTPAVATLLDIGNTRGLIRVLAVGTALGVAPLHERWR